MSAPGQPIRTSEDARRQAEWHRREIVHTLDELSARLTTTMDRAQQQVQKPLRWMSGHPYATLAASVAIGFLLAGAAGWRRRSVVARELEEAYRLGQHDALGGHPVRGRDFWTDATTFLESHGGRAEIAHPPSLRRNLFASLAQPLVSSLGSLIAHQLASRWQR